MRVLRGNDIVINWTIRRDIDGNGTYITPDEIGFIKNGIYRESIVGRVVEI